MINHVSIGVTDLAAARRFYDATLASLGYKRVSESAEALSYGPENASLWVLAVERPVPPDAKSGLHFCLEAGSRGAVDAFYAAALRSGGRDNGKPRLRSDYGANY